MSRVMVRAESSFVLFSDVPPPSLLLELLSIVCDPLDTRHPMHTRMRHTHRCMCVSLSVLVFLDRHVCRAVRALFVLCVGSIVVVVGCRCRCR